ncbi:MAG: TfoX/Sxy family protein, partial [Vitreimonas sp.]
PVQVKRMFGGAGGYTDGVMFLLIADDVIYLKTDEALRAELREQGCGPFVWAPQSGQRKGEKVDLGYWRLPDSAMDDPDEAARWGAKALAVAKAKAAAKPKRKPKR